MPEKKIDLKITWIECFLNTLFNVLFNALLFAFKSTEQTLTGEKLESYLQGFFCFLLFQGALQLN